MPASKALASIFARWLHHTFTCSSVAMVVAGVLALTFEILGSEDRNVSEHFAGALRCYIVSTIDFFGFNIVEEMVFVAMSAKTLTRWT